MKNKTSVNIRLIIIISANGIFLRLGNIIYHAYFASANYRLFFYSLLQTRFPCTKIYLNSIRLSHSKTQHAHISIAESTNRALSPRVNRSQTTPPAREKKKKNAKGKKALPVASPPGIKLRKSIFARASIATPPLSPPHLRKHPSPPEYSASERANLGARGAEKKCA